MKILCVEDDINFGQLLKKILVRHNYQVDWVEDGESAWKLAKESVYDLIILDLLLPTMNGIHLCQLIRSDKYSGGCCNQNTPVILMTGLDAVTNKIAGLDAGADDYIVKPFDIEELLARIRALLRRSLNQLSPLLTWGELYLNPNSCEVSYGGKPIQLAKKEYEILEMFLRHPQQIFSHNLLLDSLWETNEMPTQGALRAHIKGLRNKLRKAGVNDIFETVYKLGYRLKPLTDIKPNQLPKTAATATITAINIAPDENISPELQKLWQQSRHSYQERLLIIQKTITALQQGKLTTEQQHEAAREAHTLYGSLGSFGLDKAAEIALQIQQILQNAQAFITINIPELKLLVTQLQQYLNIETSTISSGNQLINSRLLIIDNDVILANQIATEAFNWGLMTQIASNNEQAHTMLTDAAVDLILLDLNYQNNVKLGLDFLAELRQHYSDIPVVIITQEDSFHTRLEVARLGIKCFLQKPISSSQVLVSLTQVLKQQQLFSYRLLVVDDDPVILKLVNQLLSPYGYEIILLDQPWKFWETLEQTNPDLLILDVELFTIDNNNKLPLNGFDLCQVIRNDLRWNRLPILFLSAHTDQETIQHSFAVGANDFLTKPIVATELQTRVQRRLEQQHIWKLTEIDTLTGVSIRRKALQDLTRLLQQAQRQQQSLSLALLDLDFFKSINDRYGHPVGDRVLNYLGQLLNQSFRLEDVVGRWGGEEFVVGMYGVTGQVTRERLIQVLQKLQQHSFTTVEGSVFQVTFSAGIAQFPHDGQDLQTLFQVADVTLYQAKQQGRNLVLLTAKDYTQS